MNSDDKHKTHIYLNSKMALVIGGKIHLPAGMEVRPTHIVPFMKVPVVSTAARQRNVMPKKVRTPTT